MKCRDCRGVAVSFVLTLMLGHGFGDGTPVFHLDFSVPADRSISGLEIEVGEAVTLVADGGPTLPGGATLSSGVWAGVEDETNQILVPDNPILDAVSVNAGSIVTWIKPEDGEEWNNIAKTVCPDGIEPCAAFSQFVGFEFQASGPHAGVFGAVQGWNTNVFGPDTPLGDPTYTDTPSGEWTHAALTWNAVGDHTIYVNGQAGEPVIGVGDGATFGENDPGGWTIGGDRLGTHPQNSDGTRYLRGGLADFAIYDGELTAAEIADIMEFGVNTELAPAIPGDFNDDGIVDLADYSIQIDNFNTRNVGFAEGDFNGDRRVDLSDFIGLRAIFAEGRLQATSVPEPNLFCWLAAGLVLLFHRLTNAELRR